MMSSVREAQLISDRLLRVYWQRNGKEQEKSFQRQTPAPPKARAKWEARNEEV